MSAQLQPMNDESKPPHVIAVFNPENRQRRGLAIKALVLLVVFALGSAGGYMMGRQSMHTEATSQSQPQKNAMLLMQQVNPPEDYEIPVVFGDVGLQLVAAGAIDLAKFTELYQQQKKSLTDNQKILLTKETVAHVVINPDNAAFLLNFFWALGLVNQNEILTDGQMMSGGSNKVGNFASTGGWTLGVKSPTELFASTKIITLTDKQQARLLEVAAGVYRPCCNNPTDFPDCNHGMAMLGLLELMASQNATTDEMFETAKYVNAFWYPQQMLEVATAIQASKNVDFKNSDAREVVSYQFSSISGFQAVHQWLSQNGLLELAPSNGGSCGVQ